MIFVSAFLTGVLLVVLTSYLIKTPEEQANEFIEELKAGTISDDSVENKREELEAFIKFPETKELDQTRMIIDSAEDVDNGYEVRARFQAYEYKDEGSEVIESYDGDLYIIMKKVGFRDWDIIDVRINPYE
ncbi:hypothetical protein ACSVDE_01400 [Pseudalkalibacillus sp. Hm43]|uniref:hypothetical protein n=1 Tax=Pseudalkalibacillus sp. Hm43 TaxID=3450742 RepID=UPI003F42E1E7